MGKTPVNSKAGKNKSSDILAPLLLIIMILIIVISAVVIPQIIHTASNQIVIMPQFDTSDTRVVPTVTPNPPVKKSTAITEPFLTARAVLVVDESSRKPLFGYNERIPLWPASTTKLMTALIARDEYDLDDEVIVQNPVSEGSSMGLVEGETITVEHLLHGLLIQSANDAAFALADHYKEGRAGFVAKMNDKAQVLGLENTHFVDPAGFDNEKQYTTATDLATLTLEALDDQVVRSIVGIPAITVPDANFTIFHKLNNINTLLGSVPGFGGVKTGYTENAKENLVTMIKRSDNSVIVVILGSDDRFGETQVLTDWIYDSYVWDNAQVITDKIEQENLELTETY